MLRFLNRRNSQAQHQNASSSTRNPALVPVRRGWFCCSRPDDVVSPRQRTPSGQSSTNGLSSLPSTSLGSSRNSLFDDFGEVGSPPQWQVGLKKPADVGKWTHSIQDKEPTELLKKWIEDEPLVGFYTAYERMRSVCPIKQGVITGIRHKAEELSKEHFWLQERWFHDHQDFTGEGVAMIRLYTYDAPPEQGQNQNQNCQPQSCHYVINDNLRSAVARMQRMVEEGKSAHLETVKADLKNVLPAIKLLDEALKHMPSRFHVTVTSDRVTLHRGARTRYPKIRDSFPPGDKVAFEQFLSFSHLKEVGDMFCTANLQAYGEGERQPVERAYGTRFIVNACSGYNIGKLSFYATEWEVLQRPFAVYVVTGVDSTVSPSAPDVVRLREVPREDEGLTHKIQSLPQQPPQSPQPNRAVISQDQIVYVNNYPLHQPRQHPPPQQQPQQHNLKPGQPYQPHQSLQPPALGYADGQHGWQASQTGDVRHFGQSY